ncbi:MAG: carboxypeptidase-like regulatory domain-containing protein [Telluria sp.]
MRIRHPWICRFIVTLLGLLLGWCAAAQTQQDDASNVVLLEVKLDQHLLADAITGYQLGNDVFLPLGELSRLLTIAIRSEPASGRASGYILDEQRGFSLDIARREVTLNHQRAVLDPALVRVRADDIYVASRLLERWLPARLEIDLPILTLRVHPREKLPLQARLERSNSKRGAPPGRYTDPDYPRWPTPYRLLDPPFIDQTLGIELRGGDEGGRRSAAYTAYLTADLARLEAQLYFNRDWPGGATDLRWSLGRNDPDANLLGPLHARSAIVGSVASPGVANIAQSSATGNGAALANRPLNQPTSFDRHSLQGPLPPGWDVELYFNEALVGFQQSRADGKYSFDDLPLVYGTNEFRLVFHGPLGQLRIERQTFLLEQSILAPGQLYYHLSAQRGEDGRDRTVAQFEWGLGKRLNATGGLVRLPLGAHERRYANAGLRAYLQPFILSADVARSGEGGTLAQAGVKTRLLGLSLAASHAQVRDFTSELFQPAADAVRARDEVSVDGKLPGLDWLRMPLSMQARRDRLDSGARNVELQGRLSTYQFGTALSNTVRWQSLRGARTAEGVLQASRRVAGIGISGQLNYAIRPQVAASTLAISADKVVAEGYQINLGVVRGFVDRQHRLTAALSKSLGSFGLGINGFYSSRGDYGAGFQLFVAMGREPRRGRWIANAQPMAASGAASVRVFLDKNQNGVMDADDQPLPGAGFTINGGGTLARTGDDGIAYLNRLPAGHNVDIGFDVSTLAEPQLAAQQQGYRIAARAGKVSQLDFAVSVTGEIDGTTYMLADGGARRAVGDLELELVDRTQRVVATAMSASDGYFVIPSVLPGTYMLRVSPQQLSRLNLTADGAQEVTMTPDGKFVNGRELVVQAGAPLQ